MTLKSCRFLIIDKLLLNHVGLFQVLVFAVLLVTLDRYRGYFQFLKLFYYHCQAQVQVQVRLGSGEGQEAQRTQNSRIWT